MWQTGLVLSLAAVISPAADPTTSIRSGLYPMSSATSPGHGVDTWRAQARNLKPRLASARIAFKGLRSAQALETSPEIREVFVDPVRLSDQMKAWLRKEVGKGAVEGESLTVELLDVMVERTDKDVWVWDLVPEGPGKESRLIADRDANAAPGIRSTQLQADKSPVKTAFHQVARIPFRIVDSQGAVLLEGVSVGRAQDSRTGRKKAAREACTEALMILGRFLSQAT